STGSTDLPSREDVQELRQAIESLRDHVQIVWQAIDEVRDVIGQTIGHDAQEFWNVEPPQGFPLGRYRPFAGYNPFDEWHSQNAGAVEPAAVAQTNNFDDAADSELPDDSFENAPPATADTHRHNGHEVAWPAIAPPTQQR